MSHHKIAIVNSSSFGRIFPNHLERLRNIGEVEYFNFPQEIPGKELAENLKGYDIIIASVTPFFDTEFFEHKDELLLISRHGIGFNNVNLEAARKHNTIVSIIPALVERDAVAGNNITNLLAVMRRTVGALDAVEENQWERRASFIGHSLYNKKLEIEQHGAEKVEFEDLIRNSDVICLCANLTEENYHFISKKEIEMMKPNVYISNSARGALVDEKAIVEGLKSGKIAGFATDVLEVEPGRANHPYLAFENVVVTPHTSAYTMECLEAMGEKCVEDCEVIVEGKLPVRSVQSKSSYVKGEVK